MKKIRLPVDWYEKNHRQDSLRFHGHIEIDMITIIQYVPHITKKEYQKYKDLVSVHWIVKKTNCTKDPFVIIWTLEQYGYY